MKNTTREAVSLTTAGTLCHICGIRLGDEGLSTCSACIDALSWQAHERECERAAIALINERQRRA